jgi:hypothetical protein
MRASIRWLLVLGIPMVIACQRDQTDLQYPSTLPVQNQALNNTSSFATARPQLVRTADGVDLSIPCLQSVAPQIEQAAQSSLQEAQQVANQCNVRAMSTQLSSRGFDWDDYRKYCYNGTNYAYYYYPPAYYYYPNNFYNTIYGGNYNFNGYNVLGYYYPYQYYDTNYYNYSNYTNYCGSFCLYGYSSGCLSRCYYSTTF